MVRERRNCYANRIGLSIWLECKQAQKILAHANVFCLTYANKWVRYMQSYIHLIMIICMHMHVCMCLSVYVCVCACVCVHSLVYFISEKSFKSEGRKFVALNINFKDKFKAVERCKQETETGEPGGKVFYILINYFNFKYLWLSSACSFRMIISECIIKIIFRMKWFLMIISDHYIRCTIKMIVPMKKVISDDYLYQNCIIKIIYQMKKVISNDHFCRLYQNWIIKMANSSLVLWWLFLINVINYSIIQYFKMKKCDFFEKKNAFIKATKPTNAISYLLKQLW